MILVDANLLLYAYDSESPHHKTSRDWLEGALLRKIPPSDERARD